MIGRKISRYFHGHPIRNKTKPIAKFSYSFPPFLPVTHIWFEFTLVFRTVCVSGHGDHIGLAREQARVWGLSTSSARGQATGETPPRQTPPSRIASLLYSLFATRAWVLECEHACGLSLVWFYDTHFKTALITPRLAQAIADYSAIKVQPILLCLCLHFCLEPQFLEHNQERQKLAVEKLDVRLRYWE